MRRRRSISNIANSGARAGSGTVVRNTPSEPSKKSAKKTNSLPLRPRLLNVNELMALPSSVSVRSITFNS